MLKYKLILCFAVTPLSQFCGELKVRKWGNAVVVGCCLSYFFLVFFIIISPFIFSLQFLISSSRVFNNIKYFRNSQIRILNCFYLESQHMNHMIFPSPHNYDIYPSGRFVSQIYCKRREYCLTEQITNSVKSTITSINIFYLITLFCKNISGCKYMSQHNFQQWLKNVSSALKGTGILNLKH